MSGDTTEMQDLASLKRAMNDKDANALKALHAKYYTRTKHFITSRIGSGADAEDIAQDVFFQFWKPGACHDVQRTVEAYLFGIARRLIGEYFRNLKRQLKTVPLESVGEIADHRNHQPNGGRFENISRPELKRLIKDAAAELPRKSREAIVLRFIGGLSTREAAREAGCSEAAFYGRVERAVRILREIVRKKRSLQER